MIRGEIWLHAPTLGTTVSPRRDLVAIISDQMIIESPYRWLHVVPISDADPGHVLATLTSHGWADVLELTRVYRPWVTEKVGELTGEELDALDARLRTAQGLNRPD
ncbi:hypothetical protein [Nocardia sp. NPDC056000]|uniref:hypothetical protein n=1 Tax=Nocardia sp. NPDC056000 TaxID=3345674 RepID=UPI0035D77C38